MSEHNLIDKKNIWVNTDNEKHHIRTEGISFQSWVLADYIIINDKKQVSYAAIRTKKYNDALRKIQI